MSDEWWEKEKVYSESMLKKYPNLFEKEFFGFEIGEGWRPIVEDLCDKIYAYLEEDKNRRQVTVEQIKEKFGGLRFYYSGGDEYVRKLVDAAETKADTTCEVCGEPGKERPTAWIKTLCDTHHAERDKRIREYTDKK